MRLLLTRPEPGIDATAQRLSALGHTWVRAPILRLEDTGTAIPAGSWDAIAFTSVNGVLAFARTPGTLGALHLPVYAVGSRTAAQARATGFAVVRDAQGDVRALAHLIGAHLPAGSRLLQAAGVDRAGENVGAGLAALLAAHGIRVDVCELYQAMPVAALPQEAEAALALGQLDAALHYSPRSAMSLLKAVFAPDLRAALARIDHLCLSAAVAAPLRQAGLRVQVSARPDEDSLLDLLKPPV